MEQIEKWLEQKLPHGDAILFCIVVFYFALRLFFFATSIAPGIAPDETDHTKLIVLYSQYDGFSLPESRATAEIDLVTHRPNLYFWLMGKLLFFNFFSLPTLLFLRLLHVLMSILTLMISFRLFRLLTNDKLISLLGVIVLTNIPMYSFLGAFVTYDNLLGLLAASSFYFLFKFLKTHKAKDLFALIITSLLGTLTKFPFLLLLIIFMLIGVLDWIKNKKQYSDLLSPKKWKLTPKNGAALALIAGLLYLNASFYLMNIVRYQRILPRCDQVLPFEQCMQKKNFHIDTMLGDRAKKIPPASFLKMHGYVGPWIKRIEKTILGIFGHKVMLKTSKDLLAYNILLLVFLLFFLRHFRFQDPWINYSILSVLLYGWVLFYHVSYKIFYLNSGYVEANLQGRYLFPVITPIVFLFASFMLAVKKKALKVILFLIVSFVFILGDLPYFLKHADKSWYMKDWRETEKSVQLSS